MNRTIASVLAVSALAFAGQAFAETPTIDNSNFVSTASRAQVQADLAAYKQAGVNPWSIQYDPLKTFSSTLSRQQVVAEFIGERDVVAATTGEDSGSAYFAQAGVKHGASNTRLAGGFLNTK
jgi:hypothetical protein